MILPPKKDASGSTIEKYKSLFKSLTGKNYIYSGDISPAPHQGIKVRVSWKDQSGKILRTREVYSDDGDSRIRTTAGASFTLDAMALKPGDYVVTVDVLEADSRFDGTFKTAICTGFIVY
jgi:hypothetical protein